MIDPLKRFYTNLTPRNRKAFWLLTAVAIYGILGVFAVPAVLQRVVAPAATDAVGRRVEVGSFSYNPFALSLAAHDIRMEGRHTEHALEVDELAVNVQLASLWHRALVLRELRVVRPSVSVAILADGTQSWRDIAEHLEAQAAQEEETAGDAADESDAPFPLLVYSAVIEQGRVAFADESHPTPFREEISPIDLEIENFSTLEGEDALHSFEASTQNGATVRWSGDVSLQPLSSEGRIEIADFRSRTPWSYLRDDLRFEVASGTADLSLDYVFTGTGDAPGLVANDILFTLDGVTIFGEDDTEPVISIPALRVAGGRLDVPERSLEIAKISADDCAFKVLRDPDGGLHYTRLFAPKPAAETPDSDPAGEAAATAADAEQNDASAPGPWRWSIGEVALGGFSVAFRDESVTPPALVNVKPLSLSVQGISGDEASPPATLSASATIVQGGAIDVRGNFSPTTAAAELETTLESLALAPLAPYAAAAAGAVPAAGTLGGTIKTTVKPSAAMPDVNGTITISELDLNDTEGGDVLAVAALNVTGIALAGAEAKLSIESIAIDGPQLNVRIDPDGTSNLDLEPTAPPQPAAGPSEPPAESPSSEPLAYSVGPVNVNAGVVAIKDLSLPRKFSMELSEINGQIDGVSSRTDANVRAKVAAKLARTSPVSIDAALTPNAEKLNGHLKVGLTNLDTARLSPYSGKHVGQEIAAGKMAVDLDYKITDSKLVALNNVGLANFAMGSRVKSDDAQELPIGLAVALLKDVNGHIDVSVPVEGRLDDPGFRLGGVILKAFTNLIVKAAAAPFTLLGSLVPGVGEGEDLSSVAFAPGSSALSDGERAKLGKLVQALAERPNLALEVTGAVAPEIDEPAYRRATVELRLKSMRFEKIRKRSDAPESADAVVLEADDRLDLLEDAYDDDFDQSRRSLRREAPETDENGNEIDDDEWAYAEMERRLLAAVDAGESRMLALASARAEQIRAALVADEAIDPSRIRVASPRLDAAASISSVANPMAIVPAGM